MNPFLFPWERTTLGARSAELWLVAFVIEPTFDPQSFAQFVGDEQHRRPVYRGVIVLGFGYNKLALSNARESVSDRLPFTQREAGSSALQVWCIARDGAVEADGSPLPQSEVRKLFAAGSLAMFCGDGRVPTRSPLLVAPMGFHFVKPSGNEHTTHFIRAAEALTDGTEIAFLGASLLRMLRSDTRTVYCDTGSIAALGFAIEVILSRFAAAENCSHVPIGVRSFGSWDGFRGDGGGRRNHSFEPTALYVISASTSGHLARRMRRCGYCDERIVTLFYHGDDKPVGEVICQIRPGQKMGSRGALDKIENFPARRCPLCARGSVKLKLTGEQFLPVVATPYALELKLCDRPDWLESFMGSARGTGAIRVHHGVGKRSHTHEIFIAFDRLCSDQKSAYAKKLERALRQSVPVSADRIYYCSDEGSEGLAIRIADDMEKRGVPRPELRALTDLKREFRKRVGRASIVAAGCVCSGRSLVDLSRTLRDVEVNGAITYLLGLRRTESKSDQESLQNTLIWSDGPTPFSLQSAQDIYVPDNTAQRDSIWGREARLLEDMLAESRRKQTTFPIDVVSERLALIREAEGEIRRGMEDQLFWPSADGKPLELGPNFSLFRIPKRKRATQAEIFFAISAMLHKLRNAPPHERRLVSSEHQRSLIHPKTFLRFSDSVLRAGILRAALYSELDYEISPRIEAEMMAILVNVFSSNGGKDGESASEFLLALALNQLRLSPPSIAQVLNVAAATFPDSTRIEFHLIERVRTNLSHPGGFAL